jgi:hypothetical protein
MTDQQQNDAVQGSGCVTPVPATQPKITWEYVKELLSDSKKFNALPLARQKEIAAWLAVAS